MHYSLLYSYGGPTPVEWQVHNKEKTTGVSVHFISSKIDRGKIIVQQKTEMPEPCKNHLVYKKLDPIGNDCVVKAIEIIKKIQIMCLLLNQNIQIRILVILNKIIYFLFLISIHF